ncbi:hypothetical protein TELCIR_00621, partial [Teladorsagia circumcincta]
LIYSSFKVQLTSVTTCEHNLHGNPVNLITVGTFLGRSVSTGRRQGRHRFPNPRNGHWAVDFAVVRCEKLCIGLEVEVTAPWQRGT